MPEFSLYHDRNPSRSLEIHAMTAKNDPASKSTGRASRSGKLPRRRFLAAAAAAGATAAIGPTFVRGADKAGSRLPILGTGEFTYEATHNWGKLPTHIHWGDTHGVVFDKDG